MFQISEWPVSNKFPMISRYEAFPVAQENLWLLISLHGIKLAGNPDIINKKELHLPSANLFMTFQKRKRIHAFSLKYTNALHCFLKKILKLYFGSWNSKNLDFAVHLTLSVAVLYWQNIQNMINFEWQHFIFVFQDENKIKNMANNASQWVKSRTLEVLLMSLTHYNSVNVLCIYLHKSIRTHYLDETLLLFMFLKYSSI